MCYWSGIFDDPVPSSRSFPLCFPIHITDHFRSAFPRRGLLPPVSSLDKCHFRSLFAPCHFRSLLLPATSGPGGALALATSGRYSFLPLPVQQVHYSFHHFRLLFLPATSGHYSLPPLPVQDVQSGSSLFRSARRGCAPGSAMPPGWPGLAPFRIPTPSLTNIRQVFGSE